RMPFSPGPTSSSSRRPCASVSGPIGDRPPISEYSCRACGARRLATHRANHRRRNPLRNGIRIKNGSRKRFTRYGSTASSESGPPRLSNKTPVCGGTRRGLIGIGDTLVGHSNRTSCEGCPRRVSPKAVPKFLPAEGFGDAALGAVVALELVGHVLVVLEDRAGVVDPLLQVG